MSDAVWKLPQTPIRIRDEAVEYMKSRGISEENPSSARTGIDSHGVSWHGYTDSNGNVTSFFPED